MYIAEESNTVVIFNGSRKTNKKGGKTIATEASLNPQERRKIDQPDKYDTCGSLTRHLEAASEGGI